MSEPRMYRIVYQQTHIREMQHHDELAYSAEEAIFQAKLKWARYMGLPDVLAVGPKPEDDER